MFTADEVRQLVEQARACLKPGSRAMVGARDDDDVMQAFLNDILRIVAEVQTNDHPDCLPFRVLRNTLQAKWYAETAFHNNHLCLEVLRTLQRKAAQELAQ